MAFPLEGSAYDSAFACRRMVSEVFTVHLECFAGSGLDPLAIDVDAVFDEQ